MTKELDRIRHDLKRIATAVKMLVDELDTPATDVEDTIQKEDK